MATLVTNGFKHFDILALIRHLRGCVTPDILAQLAALPEGSLTGFEALKLVLVWNFICQGGLLTAVSPDLSTRTRLN